MGGLYTGLLILLALTLLTPYFYFIPKGERVYILRLFSHTIIYLLISNYYSLAGGRHHLRRHLHDRVRGRQADVEVEQEGPHPDLCHLRAVPRHRGRVRHRRRRRHKPDIPPLPLGPSPGPRGEILRTYIQMILRLLRA